MTLRTLRISRGLTQQQLARRAGVSLQTVSNLERGVHHPKQPTKRRVLGALGIPMAKSGEVFRGK